MEEVITTLNARIGKKSIARTADEAKVKNLEHQIEMYQRSIENHKESAAQKTEEIDLLINLKTEALALIGKREVLQAHTDGLRRKFDAIEWRPDMPFEDTIASTDYHEKVEERHEINARLREIEKEANKIYYRR